MFIRTTDTGNIYNRSKPRFYYQAGIGTDMIDKIIANRDMAVIKNGWQKEEEKQKEKEKQI